EMARIRTHWLGPFWLFYPESPAAAIAAGAPRNRREPAFDGSRRLQVVHEVRRRRAVGDLELRPNAPETGRRSPDRLGQRSLGGGPLRRGPGGGGHCLPLGARRRAPPRSGAPVRARENREHLGAGRG